MQFLQRWQAAIGTAPEFISFQEDFHERARMALERYCATLTENEFFEAIELLHSPVLTLLDNKHSSPDELFERWTKKNLHILAIEAGIDRRRLGLRNRWEPRQSGGIRIPSIQQFTATLANTSHSIGREALWISFHRIWLK